MKKILSKICIFFVVFYLGNSFLLLKPVLAANPESPNDKKVDIFHQEVSNNENIGILPRNKQPQNPRSPLNSLKVQQPASSRLVLRQGPHIKKAQISSELSQRSETSLGKVEDHSPYPRSEESEDIQERPFPKIYYNPPSPMSEASSGKVEDHSPSPSSKKSEDVQERPFPKIYYNPPSPMSEASSGKVEDHSPSPSSKKSENVQERPFPKIDYNPPLPRSEASSGKVEDHSPSQSSKESEDIQERPFPKIYYNPPSPMSEASSGKVEDHSPSPSSKKSEDVQERPFPKIDYNPPSPSSKKYSDKSKSFISPFRSTEPSANLCDNQLTIHESASVLNKIALSEAKTDTRLKFMDIEKWINSLHDNPTPVEDYHINENCTMGNIVSMEQLFVNLPRIADVPILSTATIDSRITPEKLPASLPDPSVSRATHETIDSGVVAEILPRELPESAAVSGVPAVTIDSKMAPETLSIKLPNPSVSRATHETIDSGVIAEILPRELPESAAASGVPAVTIDSKMAPETLSVNLPNPSVSQAVLVTIDSLVTPEILPRELPESVAISGVPAVTMDSKMAPETLSIKLPNPSVSRAAIATIDHLVTPEILPTDLPGPAAVSRVPAITMDSKMAPEKLPARLPDPSVSSMVQVGTMNSGVRPEILPMQLPTSVDTSEVPFATIDSKITPEKLSIKLPNPSVPRATYETIDPGVVAEILPTELPGPAAVSRVPEVIMDSKITPETLSVNLPKPIVSSSHIATINSAVDSPTISYIKEATETLSITEEYLKQDISESSLEYSKDYTSSLQSISQEKVAVVEVMQCFDVFSNRLISRMDQSWHGNNWPAIMVNRVMAAGDGSEEYYKRKNIWTNIFISSSDQKEFKKSPGFKSKQNGLIAGIDYEFKENLILGVGYSMVNAKTKFNDTLYDANQKAKAHILALYGSARLHNNITLNAQLKYGKMFLKASSKNQNSKKYIGKTSGNLLSARVDSGYIIPILSNTVFIPKIGLSYDCFNVKRLRIPQNFQMPDRNGYKINTILGATLKSTIQKGKYTLIPELRFNMNHVILSSDKFFEIVALKSNVINSDIESSKALKTTYTIGSSISVMHFNNIEFGLNYDYSFRRKFKSHSGYVNIALRM